MKRLGEKITKRMVDDRGPDSAASLAHISEEECGEEDREPRGVGNHEKVDESKIRGLNKERGKGKRGAEDAAAGGKEVPEPRLEIAPKKDLLCKRDDEELAQDEKRGDRDRIERERIRRSVDEGVGEDEGREGEEGDAEGVRGLARGL